MKPHLQASLRVPLKFRMPTAENLIPIRIEVEIDGQRYKDAFTWNPSDPDSEVVVFAKRTVKDLKLPPGFTPQIAQSIQSQLTEFRSYEGQDMYVAEKIVPIKLDLRVNNTLIKDQFLWDLSNLESDPEEFARTFCCDMDIQDPEVGVSKASLIYGIVEESYKQSADPAVAFAIREQLYEIATQSVATAKEAKVSKKGRRGADFVSASKSGVAAVDLVKLFGHRSSVVRKRKEWDVYEPIVDILSKEEVEALEAKEERIAR
ncbi:hypothetical protein V2J09_014477 [Rumex salicifolius]